METAEIRRKSVVRLAIAPPALGLVFFLPAGTLHYWQAWIILIEYTFLSLGMFFYFTRRDPSVLGRRLKFREKEPLQRRITTGALPFVVAAFLLPGFDKRFGWSDVPLSIEIAGLILVMLGYVLFFIVLKANRFAARTVRIEEGQRIITTGPYAIVRHPMYFALIVYLWCQTVRLMDVVVNALLTLYVLIGTWLEERKLVLEFGEEYRRYQREVPMLVPFAPKSRR